jgi:plasmid stabilization system protein ParE
MKRTVRFLPEAQVDLLETRQWYASREPGLGQTFAKAIAAAVERIVVRQFPYAVYFQEVGDEILVLAVQGRQHPRRWQGRI